MKRWFYRFTAVHFIVTSLTGVALYFRPGENRSGLYSESTKEWLVMSHNGEWLSYVLFGRPFWSGMLIGLLLSFTLIRFSMAALRRRKVPVRDRRDAAGVPQPRPGWKVLPFRPRAQAQAAE